MDLSERKEYLTKNKRCFLCFKLNHLARDYRYQIRCSKPGCGRRHHALMHNDEFKPNPKANVPQLNEAVNCSTLRTCNRVCLGIVPVKLIGSRGEICTYAFLDNGSDSTLIHKDVASSLGLTGTDKVVTLSTANGTSTLKCSEVRLVVTSLAGDESIKIDSAFTMDSLPVSEVDIPNKNELAKWHHLKDLHLPRLINAGVSILIGSDVPEAHWALEQKIGRRKQPYGVRTMLGWVLFGPMQASQPVSSFVNFTNVNYLSINDRLRQMFNFEFSDPSNSEERSLSIEDRQALTYVKGNVRHIDGHYEVSLPWKAGGNILPDNKTMAEKRLLFLKRRFQANPELYEKYKLTIRNHMDKGYISKCDDSKVTSDCKRWYIPHHPVLNPNKPGKVRVVFDCAARFGGISLNDQLLQGPDLLNDLTGILMRFRVNRVAVAADIEEMFLQVKVPFHDRRSLSFLWWEDSDLNKNIKEYQLNVHPFGATSSPFCASFALRKTVMDNQEKLQSARAEIILKSFYVDDFMMSCNSINEAIDIFKEVTQVTKMGGFRLTKWISNKREVLSAVPTSERAPSMVDIDVKTLPSERMLGIKWNVEDDVFGYKLSIPNRPPTRRGILTCVASLYDPLGFVAPILLPAKMLLQKLCKENMGWDEEISEENLGVWKLWLKDVLLIEKINIPRCFTYNGFNVKETQLHLFSDASETGYGAVAYLRFTSYVGQIHCSFVMAKSRVTPTKPITIPRLELTAALLATKLMKHVKGELGIKLKRVNFWIDSTIVLHYMRNTSTRFSTFVVNRLAYLQEFSSIDEWGYISTKENPADHASRGLKASESHKLKQWFRGPEFLWKEENIWPVRNVDLINVEGIEKKKKAVVNHINTSTSSNLSVLSYCSCWYQLQRTIAWIARFKIYLLIQIKKLDISSLTMGPLQMSDLKSAVNDIARIVQRQAFPDEVRNFQNYKGNNYNGQLRKLNPIFVDGLLRVGGRLGSANLSEEFKHPIIMPCHHHVTDLIIRYYHTIEGHTGTAQTLSAVRSKFWIIKGLSAVRRVIGKCITCREKSARPEQQLMADLPLMRVATNEYPFMTVGVDYFGPFMVKRGRGTEKRYGCLFTCLRMRAVHIEIAHTLSSDSFIMAFMRFVARRGTPREICSDNGTNFTGAEKDIKRSMDSWHVNRIRDKLLRVEVDWHFNTPHCSHRGGVWERLIRSIRRILTSICKEQTMSDESLLTFMTEVERIMNDRPLVPVLDDPNGLEVLTPNKMILLRTPVEEKLPLIDGNNIYSRRWKHAQYLADVFWKRWIKEYLPNLQLRHKWTVKSKNLKKGDLVLVLNEKCSRGQWPKGVIEEVVISDDGLVRKAYVRTTKGVVQRDVRSLCLLEGDSETET